MEGEIALKRVVVIGGAGFFGRAAACLLRERGLGPEVASRRGRGGLRLDAEDPRALREALRPGDVVVDAAGPFHRRTAALVEAALDVGFDLVDLSDSPDHVLRVVSLGDRIEARGIRVLTSCSSLTTLAVVLARWTGAGTPARVSVFLSPATRETANPGTAAALRRSLGRPIRILRGGRVSGAIGWRESRPFQMPRPPGPGVGCLADSPLWVTLPRIWPDLTDADFWVDARMPGMNRFFGAVARFPALGALVGLGQAAGLPLARLLGARAGGMRVEVESGSGAAAWALVRAPSRSYLAAVAPAVLAAQALAEGRFRGRGLVPHDRHVDTGELLAYLRVLGIECSTGT